MCVAILLAAGESIRTNSKIPKQLHNFNGVTMLYMCLKTFLEIDEITTIIVVYNTKFRQQTLKIVEQFLQCNYIKIQMVKGGNVRSQSVYNALEYLANQVDDSNEGGQQFNPKILIHDVARPYVNTMLINNVIAALDKFDAVDVGIPVINTIKQIDVSESKALENGVCASIKNFNMLDRKSLYVTQTPQGFRFHKIWHAHQNAHENPKTHANYTCDISLYYKYFMDAITCVQGDERNIKITTSKDLQMEQNFITKVGHGFDVHKFTEPVGSGSVFFRICGIDVEHNKGVIAHSDGDVGIHALVDAIFGALALGDIGEHFPPSDEQWKGVDSVKFLEYARQKCIEMSARITNVDITIICQSPKISKYKVQMANKIAEILDIQKNTVNIKATTTENLGFLGRQEGIAAMACCMMRQSNIDL